MLWKRIKVDIIGPLKVDIIGLYKISTANKVLALMAMTMINPATGWFKIAHLPQTNSYEIQQAFNSYWLAQYHRPMDVGMGNSSGFKHYFTELLNNCGPKKKASSQNT